MERKKKRKERRKRKVKRMIKTHATIVEEEVIALQNAQVDRIVRARIKTRNLPTRFRRAYTWTPESSLHNFIIIRSLLPPHNTSHLVPLTTHWDPIITR